MVMKKHLFNTFNISQLKDCAIYLNRCTICRAIKITIVEYNKDGYVNDDVFIRGSQYCE
jgi:hypothetical protein